MSCWTSRDSLPPAIAPDVDAGEVDQRRRPISTVAPAQIGSWWVRIALSTIRPAGSAGSPPWPGSPQRRRPAPAARCGGAASSTPSAAAATGPRCAPVGAHAVPLFAGAAAAASFLPWHRSSRTDSQGQQRVHRRGRVAAVSQQPARSSPRTPPRLRPARPGPPRSGTAGPPAGRPARPGAAGSPRRPGRPRWRSAWGGRPPAAQPAGRSARRRAPASRRMRYCWGVSPVSSRSSARNRRMTIVAASAALRLTSGRAGLTGTRPLPITELLVRL